LALVLRGKNVFSSSFPPLTSCASHSVHDSRRAATSSVIARSFERKGQRRRIVIQRPLRPFFDSSLCSLTGAPCSMASTSSEAKSSTLSEEDGEPRQKKSKLQAENGQAAHHLQSFLVCPICKSVPREGPLYSCKNGHHIVVSFTRICHSL